MVHEGQWFALGIIVCCVCGGFWCFCQVLITFAVLFSIRFKSDCFLFVQFWKRLPTLQAARFLDTLLINRLAFGCG